MLFKKPAGVGYRLIAYLADVAILTFSLGWLEVLSFFGKIIAPDTFLSRYVIWRFTLIDILVYVLTSLYFILTTKFTGRTLGKALMSLRVVSDTSEKLGWIQVIYRETVGKYLSGILFIGYIIMLCDRRKRALHDILADTLVIRQFVVNKEECCPPPPPPGFAPPPPPGFAPVTNAQVPQPITPCELISQTEPVPQPDAEPQAVPQPETEPLPDATIETIN